MSLIVIWKKRERFLKEKINLIPKKYRDDEVDEVIPDEIDIENENQEMIINENQGAVLDEDVEYKQENVSVNNASEIETGSDENKSTGSYDTISVSRELEEDSVTHSGYNLRSNRDRNYARHVGRIRNDDDFIYFKKNHWVRLAIMGRIN